MQTLTESEQVYSYFINFYLIFNLLQIYYTDKASLELIARFFSFKLHK